MKIYFRNVEISTTCQTNLFVSFLLGNVSDLGKVKLADIGARQFCKDYIYACVYSCLMGRE